MNDPLYGRIAAALPEGYFLDSYIYSMAITARKLVEEVCISYFLEG